MTKVPSNLEAEARILGGAMVNIDWANELVIQGRLEYFSDPQNAHIFATIKDLVEKDQEVNLEKIFDLTRSKGVSPEHLSNLHYLSTRAIPLDELIESLKYFHFRRSIQSLGKSLFEQMESTTLPESQILDQIDKAIHSIHSAETDKKTFWELSELFKHESVFEKYGKLKSEKDQGFSVFKGIPTGYNSLDDMINSFQGSHLTILGARPGIGKTTLAVNFMKKISIDRGMPCLFFSLEMKASDIKEKLFFLTCELPLRRCSRGEISANEMEKIRVYDEKFRKKEHLVYIEDQPALTIDQIRSRSMRVKKSHDYKIIIIDYIQLAKGSAKYDQRHLEVASVSLGLKNLAKELNVPILALAQINRESDKRAEKRPLMSDLRESGQIEADADEVLLLHWENANPNRMEVDVAKNRYGPKGRIEFFFDPEISLLEDLALKYGEKKS